MAEPIRKPRVLDLFSGIGGFSLGLERAGMETAAFCEQDGYARRVLKKHWPTTWIYDDVKTLTAKRLKADGVGPIDVVCGGFPCQDISTAGKGAGIDGARSGLWSQMLRLVQETRPRWVVAENVPALRGRGADRVLTDLEGAGYSVRPVVVGAWAVGGNHQRERVWVVADAGKLRLESGRTRESLSRPRVASPKPLADASKGGRGFLPVSPGDGKTTDSQGGPDSSLSPGASREQWREAESRVRRVLDGVPSRVDRLRCLGNAVVPLIPELIGRSILRMWEGAA